GAAAGASGSRSGTSNGGTASAGPAGASGRSAPASACALSALRHHRGTVNIDFWESMHTANGQTLTTLTNAFNSSQHAVDVTLVTQASYTDTWTKYRSGLSNGQLPDVVQLTSTDLQGMVDSRSALPVQSCMAASHYQTADFIPRVLDAFKVGGVQVGMPFAISTPVLLYNKLAFAADGISAPPSTLSQMVVDAKELKAQGSGMGLKLDPWHLEAWLATANQLFVNNANGRKGRATKAVFDTATARKIWTALDQLVTSGAATTNPAQGTGEFNNLLGIGSGQYAMTIDTSAVLGTVSAVLSKGTYPDVQMGVAPLPVFSRSVKGGLEPGGSALYISNRVPKLRQAAAWQFVRFLDSTASQASWAAGTGYIPIRTSATKTSTVLGLWQRSPGYKVAYAQLVDGGSSAATAGAALGPYPQVRQAELTEEEAMLTHGTAPKAAVAAAAAKVDQVLSQYNQRVGGS
ncbi:MAG: extracellular solute-binding protein, partial [Acidimicrobiales bacterium]